MFWDGTRWIREGRSTTITGGRSNNTLASWIATGLMVVILAGITLPFRQAEAEGTRLSLAPSGAPVGATVMARVEDAPVGSTVELRWDGRPLAAPATVGGGRGKASIRFTVPDDSIGPHQVTLVTTAATGKRPRPNALPSGAAPGLLLASAPFSVLSGAPDGTAPPLPSAPPPTTAPSPSEPTAPPSTPAPTATRLASPTQPATPQPPAATPVPTPLPTAVPTPAPTPTRPPSGSGCTVTFSGDATGRTDVTGVLTSFLRATPAGATACLAAGGQYLVNGTVHLPGRDSGIVIDGAGARLFATVRSNRPILLFNQGTRNVTVRNLTLEGFNPNGRTSRAHEYAWEFGMGLSMYGVIGASISNVRILNVNGDGIYIDGEGGRWSEAISIQGVLIDGTGRQGVAITNGARNIRITGSTVRNTGMYAFDIEPDGNGSGADGVTISGNVISNYTIDSDWGPYLFAATGHAPENNIEFSNNVVYGQELRIVIQPNGYSRTNIRILNNRSDRRVGGPVITASGCSGLTISGNTQPLSGGSLTSVSGCSNVTIANNHTD